MEMKLKPSKCSGFSVCSGRASDISFHIGDNVIPSIRDEEQKFLGKLLFFSGKQEDTLSLIENTFKEGMERIQKSEVRSEYKLWIYVNYFLPSKRFLLTVHNLTSTSLMKLDRLTDKYVKMWCGIPPSATNAILHMPEGLNVRSISELYRETHTVSHARTRLKGDSIVNSVINSTLERESQYTRKKSTTIEAEATFTAAIHSTTLDDSPPIFTGENAATQQYTFNTSVRTEVKKIM